MGVVLKVAAAIGLSGVLFLGGDTMQVELQSQRLIAAVVAMRDGLSGSEEEEPFSPDVQYCRDNLELLSRYYPEEASALIAEDSICAEGPAPPGAVINDVPYYNQCEFANAEGGVEGLYQPCVAGSAPAAVMMELEYAGKGEQDIYGLFDDLWTGSRSGTSAESVERVLTAEGVFGGTYNSIDWEGLRTRIGRGNLVHMNIRSDADKAPAYGDERTCGDSCPRGSTHVTIVGISDNELIIHDPSSSLDEENRINGSYLVVSRDTLERGIYSRWTPMIVVVPDGSSPDEVVETTDGAFFDYFPTGWPDQLWKRFGDWVWWQIDDFHTGTDWFGRKGEDIYAMEAGNVVGLGCLKCTDPATATTGYGLTVTLYHGEVDGVPLYSSYSHLESALVTIGDEVEAGEVIGTMGNTGFTTPRDAYHVHVSVSMENPFYNPWDNDAESGEYKWLDPEFFLGTREP